QDYSWIQSHGGKPLLINSVGNNVGVGTTTATGATLTVGGAGATPHLQLRREASAGSAGKALYLELDQDTTADTNFTFPSIRIHQSQKLWQGMEAGSEGFLLKTGDLTSDALVDLYANTAVVTGLKIGNTVIGEAELTILRKLAAGQLQFDLYNIAHDVYA